jgi:hypothetical protein
MNRRRGGNQRWSGWYGERNNTMALTAIEPQFLDHPVYSFLIIMAMISHIQTSKVNRIQAFWAVMPLSLISLKNEKTKLKVALRKYLNIYSFYSVDEFCKYKDGS